MPRSLSFILVSVLVTPSTGLAQSVFRGPYLNNVTPDAITVVWETPTPTTGTVRYGVSQPNENTVPSGSLQTHHEVRLSGLDGLAAPGSEFVYEVEVDGIIRGGSFTTEVPGTTPFAFVVYGDNRSNTIQHEAVVDAIINEPTPFRFVVSSGDMVSDGENEDHWDDFFEIEQPLLANTPFFGAIGNHEIGGAGWDIVRRLFDYPTTESPASNSEGHYHFVYANVQIIVVDAGYQDTLYRVGDFVWGEQEVWLQDVLDNPPAGVDHRIVIIHEGPYTSKSGRTGNLYLRTWLSALRDAGVDLILSGHDHYMERGWSYNGIPYVISGGGGAPLYDTMGPRETVDHTVVMSQSILGYILVEVDGPLVQVTSKSLDGATIDYFAYGDDTSPECTTTPDCASVPEPEFPCFGGSYECINSACAFTCPVSAERLLACNPLADTCETEIGAGCPQNQAHCETPDDLNPLTWYCECSLAPQGDCQVDADCAGRPSPIPGCSGTWACDADACEFTPSDPTCTLTPPTPDGAPPPSSDGGSHGGGDTTRPIPQPGDTSTAAPGRKGCALTASSHWIATVFGFLWFFSRRRRRAEPS